MRHRLLGIALLLSLNLAHAQTPPPPQTPRTPPLCQGLEFHWMDFWIGDWIVTKAVDGAPAGKNTITALSRGCVIFENWEGATGFQGQSLNQYDPAAKVWRQNWMDQTGARLDFAGTLNASGALVLNAPAVGDGPLNRMTLTPRPDTSVRQHGEQSTDGGKTWTTQYDFIYRRRPK